MTDPFEEIFKKIIANWLPTSFHTSPAQISLMVRDTACEFQLRYTSFQFQASQLHKDFKTAKNTDEKAAACETLDDFIDTGMVIGCSELGRRLQNYFSSTRKTADPPRVSIFSVRSNDQLSHIYTSSNTPCFQHVNVDKYTPLTYILNQGLPYLDNSVHRTILKSEGYNHPGIDLDRARQVANSIGYTFRNSRLIARIRRVRNMEIDDAWNRCFITPSQNTKVAKTEHILYKSNMIVPVTFRAHSATLEKSMVRTLKLKDSGRSILGFVSVDHPTAHYFDRDPPHDGNNLDANVMYLFADLVSLMRITEFMYTSGSTTYAKFKKDKKGACHV